MSFPKGTTLKFLSPKFYLHNRIEMRAHWIGILKNDPIEFNSKLFGGKENGVFNNLPKSMIKHN